MNAFVLRKHRTRGDTGKDLGWWTIKQYGDAINNLWGHQKSLGIGYSEGPKGAAMRDLMKRVRRGLKAKEREGRQTDRGLGTLLEYYDTDRLKDLVTFCWIGWVSLKRSKSPKD